jgi:hypothetical protein
VQLGDGLLQLDEHLVAVLDVVDRLPELVLVAFDLKKNRDFNIFSVFLLPNLFQGSKL